MTVEQTGAEAVRAKLAGIAARMKDLSPQTQVIAADTHALIDDSFANSRSPDGTEFAWLATSTVLSRADKIHQRRTRALRRVARAHDEANATYEMREGFSESWIIRDGVRHSTGGNYGRTLVRTDRRRRRTADQLESEFGHLVSANGMTILVNTGRMRSSMFARGDKKSVRFGTNVKYAAFHVTGTRKMPQRNPLPITGSRGNWSLMSTGPGGEHWRKARQAIEDYILTGRVT